MIAALEQHSQPATLDVDPENEAFVNGLAYKFPAKNFRSAKGMHIHRHPSDGL